jgi:hypothetical protein
MSHPRTTEAGWTYCCATGPLGSNHELGLHSDVVEYAKEKLGSFIKNSASFGNQPEI